MKRKQVSLWLMGAILTVSIVGCGAEEQRTTAEAESIPVGLENDSAESSVEVRDGLQAAEVADIVDGDTLKVFLGGEKYTVRMIGVDTPESVHPDKSKNTVFGEEASSYAKGKIAKGQTVYLQKDVSDTDKYGRILRYVWLESPENPEDELEIREKMYNAIVIGDGYANAYYYSPDITLFPLFSQIEFEAATAESGLWIQGGLNSENVKKTEGKDKIIKEINGEYSYIGNKKSKKVHTPTCSALPKESNSVYFKTMEEALEQGYEPCGKCCKESN